MSATRPVILDRVVQYPTRVKLTDIVTSAETTYDVTAVPGTITTAGTVLNADLLNAIMDYVDAVKADTMLAAHPVGSIFESFDSTEPSVLFGGTWSTCGAGRMTIGVDGTTYVGAGETGGSATHTNTLGEMLPHVHSNHLYNLVVSYGGNSGKHDIAFNAQGNGNVNVDLEDLDQSRSTGSTGSGASYDIRNPYITVYRWRRMS